MSKLAVVCSLANQIFEQNAKQHLVFFRACVKDDHPGFNGEIECEAVVDSADNANKIRDAYVDAVVAGAATVGVTLAHSDVICPTFYRAP